MGIFKRMFGSKSKPSEPKTTEPLGGATMQTLDPTLVVDPFGKINYWDLADGGKRVRVYFLMENPIEGAQTGVAIDGSGSMQANFGKEALRQVRQLTDQDKREISRMKVNTQNQQQLLSALIKLGVYDIAPPGPNIVEEQARKMTEYLSKFDTDGGTTVTYWATGDGRQIEVVGDLQGSQCPTAAFPGPKEFGDETHLLPAIKYFVERFADARWGMYVFITDGALNDLEAVKRYCIKLARNIAKGKQNDLKFVLIGVGQDIDASQMEELDDLETGTDIDLWDHKIAREMKQLAEIFAEVVSETVIIVPGDGMIKDANGNVVKDYRDSGLPALLWFDLPPGSQWFTLEVGGRAVEQSLAAGTQMPSSPPPASLATTPCIECGEPLPSGAQVCTRCGVNQQAPAHQPSTQAAAPAAPAQISADPHELDFGAVTDWRGDLPKMELRLRNAGGSDWSGSVRSTLPWLQVSPDSVNCAAGGEVVLTVALTPAGGRLKPRAYSADDALAVEGGGQTLQVGAKVDTRK